MGALWRLVCRWRGHAEARFVMLPEFFGLYRYSRIECRRCGTTLEQGYQPTPEEEAALLGLGCGPGYVPGARTSTRCGALLAIVLLLGLAMATPATAVSTVTLETQGWWRKAGINIPSQVGEHIHLQATVPADGVPINGKVEVPVKITLHDQSGKATSFRVSDGSTVKQTWPISLGPCSDCSYSTTVTVDFSTWGTGRREMRWTANVPRNSDGKRQFQSTGWQVCIRSCSPTYRSGPYTEAGGWYPEHEYANARLTSEIGTVKSGGTIKVALKPGSGGDPTRFAGVFIDSDFHGGSAGTTVRTWTAAFTGSVTLPTLSSGHHRLVLLSSDGQNAGVLAIPFDVP